MALTLPADAGEPMQVVLIANAKQHAFPALTRQVSLRNTGGASDLRGHRRHDVVSLDGIAAWPKPADDAVDRRLDGELGLPGRVAFVARRQLSPRGSSETAERTPAATGCDT